VVRKQFARRYSPIVVRFGAMATLPPLILLLWAISAVVQITVLSLVVTRRHFHKLPLFSVYIALNLCQAALLFFVYSQFDLNSHAARQSSWLSELLILTVQTFAATEVLYRVLRHYAGIWGLAWRLIVVAAALVICHELASAKQSPEWTLMIANRGYHLTFALALISCLFLVRFYSIPIDPVYKTLLAGFCVFSCTVVVANTLLQTLFLRHFIDSGVVWNYLEMVTFLAVQIAWAVALRHRVQADDKPALSPPSTYDRLSPDVDARLRALNDALSRFLRAQVLRP
jgi:hypothetical protein